MRRACFYLLWVIMLAGRFSGGSFCIGNALHDPAAGVEFRTTCWECRKGKYAQRRFSFRQCRSTRDACDRGQGHTACDWTDDPREHREMQEQAAGRGKSPCRPYRVRWEAQFALIQRFKALHGHCNVPQGKHAVGSKGTCWHQLAIWANKQQRLRREHKLGEAREQKLKQLGFDFSHNSFVAAWEQHYVELLRFKQDWGHCNVPTGPTGRQTPGISASFVAWVDQQRRNYKSNRDTLTPLRRSRLTTVGFVWDGIQACWEESLAALVLHCKGYGQVSHRARASSDWVSTGVPSVSRLKVADVADGGERPAACAGSRGVPVWRRGPRVLVADAAKLPPRLSAWLYEQRARFARGLLTSHRVQVLGLLALLVQEYKY